MTDSRKSFVFAGLAVLFWSTIATAFKLALRELSSQQVVLIASITSAAVLFAIIVIEGSAGELKRMTIKEILRSMLMGLLNPFIYYLILLKAYSLLPAQVAQPLNMIWPIVLVFLSVPILKQKIPARSFLALFISFIGVYLITSQGKVFSPGESDLTGVILAAGSSIFWAGYFILNLKDKRTESIKLFMNFGFASIYIIVFILVTGETSGFSLKGIATGIYIGIFEMGITFFLWLKALRLAQRSDKISNLVFLAPFLSLIFISVFLKEKIHFTTILGLIVIISSLLYQNYGEVNWKKNHN